MKTALLLALVMSAHFIAHSQGPLATNILIIYSDDQSHNTIHTLGNPDIQTPNLDRLAAVGTSFTQAHVMGGHQGAVCIPSRIMMLTGRYINRLPGDGNVVPDSIVSLPEVLRSRGYITFHTGKWHSDKASYTRMFSSGANIFFGGMHFDKNGGQFHPTVNKYDPTGEYPKNNSWVSDTFSTQLYAEGAMQFLKSPEAKQKPFFCYVALTSPHDPRTPPPAFEKMYNPANMKLPPNFLPRHPFDNGDLNVRDEKLLSTPRNPDSVKREIALYYGMISEMDNQVGRILQTLKEQGLDKNTLIIFAGDNGLAVGQHGLLGKQNLYEHSIRVPMIISGPGIPANTRNNGFVYLSDIAPTIYNYLGIQPPPTVEARSLLPVLQHKQTSVRQNIYNVYGHWSRSLKTGDGFKLIVYNVKGALTTQLFNLKKDPWEMKNLSGEKRYAQKVQEMRALLKAEMQAAHDDLNIDLPDWGRKPTQRSYGS
jgi:arylsulfatase A-like enzyme